VRWEGTGRGEEGQGEVGRDRVQLGGTGCSWEGQGAVGKDRERWGGTGRGCRDRERSE